MPSDWGLHHNDPLDHPLLLNQLSIAKIALVQIPLFVKKIEAFGNDKQTWTAVVKHKHPKGVRTEYFNIGQKIKLKDDTYTIEDITRRFVKRFDKSVNSIVKDDISTVTLRSTKDSSIIVSKIKEKLIEPNIKAHIINTALNSSYIVSEGQFFEIGNSVIGIESYTVEKIDAKENFIVLISNDTGAKYMISTIK